MNRDSLTARKATLEAQGQSKLKPVLNQQSPKLQDRVYSIGDNDLVKREEIVNNHISELLWLLIVQQRDEHPKTLAIDQDVMIKVLFLTDKTIRKTNFFPWWYQRRLRHWRSSRQGKRGKLWPYRWWRNVLSNLALQSYGKHLATDYSGNFKQEHDTDI